MKAMCKRLQKTVSKKMVTWNFCQFKTPFKDAKESTKGQKVSIDKVKDIRTSLCDFNKIPSPSTPQDRIYAELPSFSNKRTDENSKKDNCVTDDKDINVDSVVELVNNIEKG